jgi:hypothetical protein
MSKKNLIVLSSLISICLSACGTEFDSRLTMVDFEEDNTTYTNTNGLLEEWDSAEELAKAAEAADESVIEVEEAGDVYDGSAAMEDWNSTEDPAETVEAAGDDYGDAYDDSDSMEAKDSAEELAQAGEAADTLQDCVPSAEQCIVAIDLTLGKKTLTQISDAVYKAIAKKLAHGGVLEDLANDNSLENVQHLTQEVRNILGLIKGLGVTLPGCELHLSVYVNKSQLREEIIQLIGKLVSNFPNKRRRSGRPGRPHPRIGRRIAMEKGLIFHRFVEPMVEEILANLERQVMDFIGDDSSVSVHILGTEEVRDDLHLVIDQNGNDVLDITGDQVNNWKNIFQSLNPFATQSSCDE